MAGKKVKSEVEGIRNELQNLSEAVWALREHVTIQTAGAAAAASTSGKPAPLKPTDIAADLNGASTRRGAVVTRGVARNASGDREYRWDVESTVDNLLTIDDERTARLLAAIGHRQRLAILKLVLDGPKTAAELVSALELGTTGAAYHHLNVLQAADLVTQEGRGVFVVQPHRVSGFFAIFAGIESASTMAVVELENGDASEDDEDPDRDDDGGKRKRKKAA